MFHFPWQAALDFSGKVVVVTGGTKGVGRAIAQRFLEAGAQVVTCARHAPAAPLTVGERTARFVEADVRDPEHADRVVRAALDAFGRLDVLVNNAGGSPPAPAATASPRFSEKIIALNLLAPIYMSQRANAQMQSQPEGGTIINIASVSGTRPSPGTAAYGAAKAGLINLTQSLAIEWAPRVRVNAITAGLLLTHDTAAHYGDAAGLARVAATVPLGRLGTPADIADACLFLASPLSRYASGSNLVLHGGGETPAFLAARDGVD